MGSIWGKIHLAIGQKWAQNAPFASIFLEFSQGRPWTPLLQKGDIIPSRIYTFKGKNSPASRISEIGALKTKNTQTFGGGGQHAIGKKRTHNAPFAFIFLKISRGRPLDPHLQEGDIHSRIYTAKVKNSPHHDVYRSGAFKTKITQKFGGKNQHAIGKKWTWNAPFASIFLKISRGRPLDPHLQEGDIHSRIYTAKG